MNSQFLVALALVALAVCPAAAAAQENGTEATNETDGRVVGPTVEVSLQGAVNDSGDPEAMETIDDDTRIVSKDYDDGKMILIIDSDKPQFVSVTDAVAIMNGGIVTPDRFALREGRNRVEFPAQKQSGKAAVTLGVGNVVYAVVVDSQLNIISGPFDGSDVQQAALGGLSSGFLVTFLIAWRRVKGVKMAPERIL